MGNRTEEKCRGRIRKVLGPPWTTRTVGFDLERWAKPPETTGLAPEPHRPTPPPAPPSPKPGPPRIADIRTRTLAQASRELFDALSSGRLGPCAEYDGEWIPA